MPKINTQPISDAHDAIFDRAMQGLNGLQKKVSSSDQGSATERSNMPSPESALDLLQRLLTRQHDLVEGLLAKAR